MERDPAGRKGSLRALLVHDHERLEELFSQLLDAFREGDQKELRWIWSRFDAGLLAHLTLEERYLLPLFEQVEPDEAAALLEEHARFRRTLEDLGVGVDLHVVKLDVAQGFVDALRAHARREDQLLYPWADRALGDSGQEAVARELGLKPTEQQEC